MEDGIAKFARMTDDPYERLKKWKADTGKGIIGCYPMYVPEEIIHAAGLLPVTIVRYEESVTKADKYLPIYTCRLVRGTFDLALQDKMDFMDGFVFADICEPVQMIADTWHIHRPARFHHNLTVPMSTASPRAKTALMGEYQNLRESLEQTFGCRISDEAVRQSIAVYNRNRGLIKKLNDFRRANPGAISPKAMVTIVTAGMLMPKEDHNQLLEKLLADLNEIDQPADGKARVILAGCFCDKPDSGLLDLLEELDAVVVDDDLYTGGRYWTVPVDEKLPPIEALAAHYINDVPCPTKLNPAHMWGDWLVEVAQRSKADAVIMMNLKYCEPVAHDYPNIRQKLMKAGIAEILIELDEDTPLGQIRTRLQALIELLGER